MKKTLSEVSPLFTCCISTNLIDRLPPWLPIDYKKIQITLELYRQPEPEVGTVRHDNSFWLGTDVTLYLDIHHIPRYTAATPSKYLTRLIRKHCRAKFADWEHAGALTYGIPTNTFLESASARNHGDNYSEKIMSAHSGRFTHDVYLEELPLVGPERALHFQHLQQDALTDMVLRTCSISAMRVHRVCFTVFEEFPTFVYPVFHASIVLSETAFYVWNKKLSIPDKYKQSHGLAIQFTPISYYMQGTVLL